MRLPACIGRSTCTNVCILAAYIEQLLFVFCDPQKKGHVPDPEMGRNSVGSPAYKFVAPVLGRWSGRLPFRKARVELRQRTSFINGFCALGCQDAGFTVYMFDKSYNCLNLFYFGTKKRKGVQRKHTDGGLKTCQGTLLGQSQGGSSLGVAEQASLDVGEGCPPATPQRAPAVLGWKRDWETGAPNQLAVGNTWGYHGDIIGISLKLPLYHRSCWRSHWRHFFGQSLITESASDETEQNPRTPSAVGLQEWIVLSFGDWAMIAYPIPSLGWCHHLPQ